MLNNFPLWPQQASTLAGHVDALYIFLLIVCGMMTLLVFGFVVYFAARFRYRPGVRAEQIEGSTALEVTWSAIPFLILWSSLPGARWSTSKSAFRQPTRLKSTSWLSSGCGRWNTRKVSVKSTNFTFPWVATSN